MLIPKKFALALTCLFIISVSTLSAQDALKMGNRILGGGIGVQMNNHDRDIPTYTSLNYINYGTDSNIKSNGFSLSPYYGRFFKDYTMIGIRLNLSSSNRTSDFYDHGSSPGLLANESQSKSAGVGTFLRFYFPVAGNFGVYTQPGLDYTRTISTNTSSSLDSASSTYNYRYKQETRNNTFSFDFKFGLYYFIFDQLAIETSLARLVLSASKGNVKNKNLTSPNNWQNDDRIGSINDSSINLNFINQLSFNQVFTLNYYF